VIGLQELSSCCYNSTPSIVYPNTSVFSCSFCLELEIAKMGRFTILPLSLSKAFFSLSPHFHFFFPVSSVNGLATLANLEMN